MSIQGKELLESLKGMRNFLGDLSQLLMTADGIMGESSWEPLWGSTCLSEMSYSVSLGHKWMPREVVRPYKNEDNFPGIIAVISILLDDYQRDYKLEEPVISGSYFAFPRGKAKEGIKLEFILGICFGYCKLKPDGSRDSIDRYKVEWKTTYGWERMEVFGEPLADITNETLLNEKIIDPLFGMIRESRQDL
jgi:hypothetical protein